MLNGCSLHCPLQTPAGAFSSRDVEVIIEADGTDSQVEIFRSNHFSDYFWVGCETVTVDWSRHPLPYSYNLQKCNSLRVRINCLGGYSCPLSY
jgi:hypothetical protein